MRYVFLAVTLVLCASRPLPVAAQVLAYDNLGYPIQTSGLYTPQPGSQFELTTRNPTGGSSLQPIGTSTPDAILHVEAQATGQDVLPLTGVCANPAGGFYWNDACGVFTAPAAGSFRVFLAAEYGTTFGTATLSFRYRSSPTAAWSSWQPLFSNQPFGGSRVNVTHDEGTGRAFVTTAMLPGGTSTHTALAWNGTSVVASGFMNGHTYQTARIEATNASAAGLTGTLTYWFGNAATPAVPQGQLPPSATPMVYPAPLYLLRDSVGSGLALDGDWDGDGLSRRLELSLGTCDYRTDALANGSGTFDCAKRSFCGALEPYNESKCRASLRDTDHDGARDDLEVFGLDTSLAMALPLFGASPSHLDVFVELDMYDQFEPSTQGSDTDTCESVGALPDGSNSDWSTSSNAKWFFDRVAEVYCDYSDGDPNAPSECSQTRKYNPDGTMGIRIHVDAGIASNLNRAETRFGAWGGGATCIREGNGCSDWRVARHPALNCGVVTTGTFGPAIDPARAWLFRHAFDNNATATHGVGGFQDGAYEGQTVDHFAHELGHAGYLDHGGPIGTAGAYVPTITNGRVNYMSRANYRYQSVGIVPNSGNAPATQLVPAAQLQAWRSATMSTGDSAIAWSMRGTPEVGGTPGALPGNLGPLLLSSLGVQNTNSATEIATRLSDGVWSVDWDRSSLGQSPSFAGTTYSENWATNAPTYRLTQPDGSRANAVGAPSIAVFGQLLVTAQVAQTSPGLTFFVDRNADCNLRPLPVARDADGFFLSHPYPNCFQTSTTTVPLTGPSPRELAVSRSFVEWGGVAQEGGIVVWSDAANQLQWGTLRQNPSATTDAGALDFYARGLVTGMQVVSAPGAFAELALAHDGLYTYVLFRGLDNQFHQSRLRNGELAWSTPVVPSVSGGGPLPFTWSPSLDRVRGNQLLLTGATGNTIGLLQLQDGLTGTWSASPLGALATINDCTDRRPSTVSAPSLNGGSLQDLRVVYKQCGSGRLWMARSGPTGNAWTQPTALSASIGTPTRFGLDMVYDARPNLPTGTDDIRLAYREQSLCTSDGQGTTTFCGGLPLSSCISLEGDSVCPQSALDIYPFSRLDPTVTTDYDDFRMMQWGFCRVSTYVRSLESPPGSGLKPFNPPVATNPYRPTSLLEPLDFCGPMPIFAEP